MFKFIRSLSFIPAFVILVGCSPQEAAMTAEDFQKPENAAALQKALASCNFVSSSDSRAANCTAAHQAKFALDAKEIGRIRREQIAKQRGLPTVEDGVTIVQKSGPAPVREVRGVPAGPGGAVRADLE